MTTTQMISNLSPSNVSPSDRVTRRIAAFQQQFGEAHFYLACHAALPLALTPDLLYCLWANFQRDIQGRLLNVPWIAVTDLLLSGLCETVGHELYEMEVTIQKELMRQLQQHPHFGQERVQELANFVIAYVAQQLDSRDLDLRDFGQAQQWRALAYKNPAAAAHNIATVLAQLDLTDMTEWIRMAALLETLADPLSDYPSFLTYAAAMADLLRGKEAEAAAKFRQILDRTDQFQVAGVNLPVPVEMVPLRQEPIALPQPDWATLTNFLRQHYLWLVTSTLATCFSLVGIVVHMTQTQKPPDIATAPTPSPSASLLSPSPPTRSPSPRTSSPPSSSATPSPSPPARVATTGLVLERSLTGHASFINSMAINQDGKTLVSGSADSTIKIWDMETGQVLRTLTGHTGYVNALDISPNGQMLVSGDADGNLRVWNLKTGELLHKLIGHVGFVSALHISPDGQMLASGDADNSIKIWNLKTGTLLHTLKGHASFINALSMSPDGKLLVSGSADGTIKIWDLATERVLRTLTGHTSYVNAVVFNPDGKTLISAGADHTIKVWDIATGKVLHTLIGHTSYVNSLAIKIDGKTLISSSADQTIRIWDLETGQQLRMLTTGSALSDYFVVSPDWQTIITGKGEGTIRVWKFQNQ
jgi:WD40 repeat protein